MIKILLRIIVLLIVGAVIFFGVLYVTPNGEARRTVKNLAAPPLKHLAPMAVPEKIPGIPKIVRAYLDYALPPQFARARLARVEATGSFRITEGKGDLPMGGVAWLTSPKPAWVWAARIWQNPMVWYQLTYRQVGGSGVFQADLMSLLTRLKGIGPYVDAALTQRWMAELVYMPSAMLPSASLSWEELHALSARMVVRQGKQIHQGIFHFDDKGQPVRFVTPSRFRDVGMGRASLHPWEVSYYDFKKIQGKKVPTRVEFAWTPGGTREVYATFKVMRVVWDNEALP